MTDHEFYLPAQAISAGTFFEFKKKLIIIMGQFFDYLASILHISGNSDKNANDKNSKLAHVSFSDGSFSQVFRTREDNSTRINSLKQSNMKTICTYEFIVLVALLVHFSLFTWPKVKLESFNIYESDGWQLVTLNLLPLVVQIGALSAMIELNKPLPEGTKLTDKHMGLELNNNEFIHSLKVIILLMVLCQLSSIFSDSLIWSVVMIVPLWCFQLTTRIARSEYEKHAPNPKKQWVKLNISNSSKVGGTPSRNTQASAKKSEATKATPRTRTRRAVKSFVSGVSDKYHAFEQNFAQQISSKILNPMSPTRAKAIES